MALGAVSHCNRHWKRAWTAQNGRRPFETPEGRMRLCHSSASANTLTLSNDRWCQVLTCWMASDGRFEFEFLKRSLPNMLDALPNNSFHWARVWHICSLAKRHFTCTYPSSMGFSSITNFFNSVPFDCIMIYLRMPRPSTTIVKKKQITCLSQYLVICVFIVPVLFDGQRKKHQQL